MSSNKIHYFSHRAYSNNPKNKLQEAIREYVLNLDRDLLDTNQLLDSLEKSKAKVAELNAKFNRCTPEAFSLNVDRDSGDIKAWFGEFMTMDYLAHRTPGTIFYPSLLNQSAVNNSNQIKKEVKQ